MNKIYKDILKVRDGHYCHAIEVSCIGELKSTIESLYEEFVDEYSFDEISEFVISLTVYYLDSDDLSSGENLEQEEFVHSFDIKSYLNELHGE